MSGFVSYYRVSTQAQGRSGLGLDAQRHSVLGYVSSVGGTLIKEFQEVESGKAASRPQLLEALKHCRTTRAVLVIAKIDRLARNVYFVSQLLESGVEFVAADMPTANKLTIHIIAAMAEHERDMIAHRTKAALKAAKARGVLLGNPNAAAQSARAALQSKQLADDFARRCLPTINAFKASGVTSYTKLALALNATGTRTQRGKLWTATGVRNVVLRAGPTTG